MPPIDDATGPTMPRLGLDLLFFPEQPGERELAAKLASLQIRPVYKPKPFELARMRMKPRQCHQNCQWYVQADPLKEHTHVLGWIVFDELFSLHSVVRNKRTGRLMCLTPIMPGCPDFPESRFAPDPLLRLDDVRGVKRDGVKMRQFVRKNPSEFIAKIREAASAAGASSTLEDFESWSRVWGHASALL